MLTLLFSVFISAITHPLYVSMTDVTYNNSTKNLEISVRVFTDDFEVALRKHTTAKVDLTNPANEKFINEMINQYIQQNLQVKAGDKFLVMQYVGYEIQQESAWIYFELPLKVSPQSLSFVNKLMYDFSEKQINLIHVKLGSTESTLKRSYPETLFSFQF